MFEVSQEVTMKFHLKWVFVLLIIGILSVGLVGFRAFDSESSFSFQIGDIWSVYTDFETGEDIFNTFIDSNGLRKVVFANTGLEMTTNEEKIFNPSFLLVSPPDSFNANVEVSLSKGDFETGAGFVCNYDYRNDEGVYFELAFDKTYTIYAINEGQVYYLIGLDAGIPEWTTESVQYYPSELIDPYGLTNIRVHCEDDYFQFGLNGEWLVDFDIPFNLPSNTLGLFSYTYSNNENVVLFDNFYAEEPHENSSVDQSDMPWSVYTTFDADYGYFEDKYDDYASIRHANDSLEVTIHPSGYSAISLFEIESPINKFVEVDVSLAEGDLETGAIISCDAFYPNNDVIIPYGTFFFMTFDGYYSIQRRMLDSSLALVNNEWQELNTEGSDYIPTDLVNPNGTNTMKMECENGVHTYFLNGTQVAQYQDFEPDYATDIALMGLTYQNPNSVIRFESFYAGAYETVPADLSTSSNNGKPTANTNTTEVETNHVGVTDDGIDYLYDEFNDALLFGEYFQEGVAEILIENGAMDMTIFANDIFLRSVPYLTTPKNVGIDVEVALVDGGLESVAGVACDFIANAEMPTRPHGYGVFFEITFDGYYAMYKNTQAGVTYYSNGEWKNFGGAVEDIPDLYQPTDLINTSGYNRLNLGCVRGTNVFSINDTKIAEFEDYPSEMNGDVVLYAGTFYEPYTSVRFDDFIAFDLSGMQ